MKKNIHPQWHKDTKVIFNNQTVMITGSTKPEVTVEIWSGNHPFYTGQELLVDTDNLIDKFNKRLEQTKKLGTALKSKRQKRLTQKSKSSISSSEVTLKDMLKSIA